MVFTRNQFIKNHYFLQAANGSFAARKSKGLIDWFQGNGKCQVAEGNLSQVLNYLLSMVEHSKEEHGHQQQ